MSLIKQLQQATNQTSLWGIVKTAWTSILFDGNFAESAMLSGSKHTVHVGTDALGNKYYEDLSGDRPYGRHRWVVYNDRSTYHASQVTAEWHAWLHCISDDAPSVRPPVKKFYEIDYIPNPSGTKDKYLPKGSWVNPAQRNWRKVQLWEPSSR